MRQIRNTPAFLICLLLAGGLRGIAQAAVEVVPCRIEESRVTLFEDDKVGRTSAAMKLTLSLSGPEAESCIRYGNLRLEEAVDDKGASLKPAKDVFHDAAKFKDYANAFFRKSKFGNTQPPAPQVELEFDPPPRSATRIVHLRGVMELADAGTLQTIELTALKSAGTKILAIPAGAKVGVTVTVASGENVRTISVEITGDEGVLESVEVVDASGKKISQGLSSWSVNAGPVQKSLNLSRPLDDTMKLVAKVCLDRKIIKVPFDLKDIALP